MAKHTSDIVADDSYLKNMDAIENIIMIGYPTGIFDEANNLPVIRRGMKWSWFLGQICGLARLRTHNQNMTVAARAIAERKTVGDLS
jgi:hypothetical protein